MKHLMRPPGTVASALRSREAAGIPRGSGRCTAASMRRQPFSSLPCIAAFILTSMTIADPTDVMIVQPEDVPNPAWLQTGIPSAGQQDWGATLVAKYLFVALPSVVSKFSWNIFFRPDRASGKYALLGQDRLVLDTRLNPPRP